MSYKEEIESLEERLSFYRRNIGRNNARDTYLTQKIKRMEEQLELFKKAKAFDEIKECLHSAQSSIDRSHGYYEGAEGNKLEMVIPLTNRSRAIDLMFQAMSLMGGGNNQQQNLSENRKEERDHAVAFFNELVEMDILEVYERTERND